MKLDALPIFPLPDVALFPGALLPLHVFEPRYREMTADVLARPRPVLAIVRLRPGHEDEYAGRPPIFATGGIGYVVDSERLADGRYHILLRGVGRVRVDDELPPLRAYREVRATLLVDSHSARPEVLEPTRLQLVAVCDSLARLLPEGKGGLRELVRSVASPGGCADAVAAALVRDPETRQALLEMLDPADRLDRVIEVVSELLGRLGGPRVLN